MLDHHTLELIGDIIHNLDHPTLPNFRATCKEFKNLTNDKWSQYCIRRLRDMYEITHAHSVILDDENIKLKKDRRIIKNECQYLREKRREEEKIGQNYKNEIEYIFENEIVEDDNSTLPPGWEKRTRHGRTYYLNHKKRKTQWERPRCFWIHNEKLLQQIEEWGIGGYIGHILGQEVDCERWEGPPKWRQGTDCDPVNRPYS